MREKIKTGIAILIIILFLPYVIVVFRTGSIQGVEEKLDPFEELVLGVLPGQISPEMELEVLKAQAVIVRTNLICHQESVEEAGYLYYSKKEREEIFGIDKYREYEEKLKLAVEMTVDQHLEYEGRTVELPFHAISGGSTRDGKYLGEEYEYLKSVSCTSDIEATDYLSIKKIKEMEEIEILEKDEVGYVTQIQIGEKILSGEEFRNQYGLKSSNFTIEKEEEHTYKIATKGSGHGFGMSIHEGNEMAIEGKQYLEILQYFYPKTECITRH